MSELSQLSPQPLWDIFAKICSIPHPSYHEEQLAEYIVGWAKEKGFHVERDQVGNILIRKPATAGMENRKPVVLQAHLDMVPQKNNDTVHDFTKDPIQPYIDGEWVKARGTTLGADLLQTFPTTGSKRCGYYGKAMFMCITGGLQ